MAVAIDRRAYEVAIWPPTPKPGHGKKESPVTERIYLQVLTLCIDTPRNTNELVAGTGVRAGWLRRLLVRWSRNGRIKRKVLVRRLPGKWETKTFIYAPPKQPRQFTEAPTTQAI